MHQYVQTNAIVVFVDQLPAEGRLHDWNIKNVSDILKLRRPFITRVSKARFVECAKVILIVLFRVCVFEDLVVFAFPGGVRAADEFV